MGLNYIREFCGGKQAFQYYIMQGLESERIKKSISIPEIDEWINRPTFSECLKDHSKVDAHFFSTISVCLDINADEFFSPLLKNIPPTEFVRRARLVRDDCEENGFVSTGPDMLGDMKNYLETLIVLGALGELE